MTGYTLNLNQSQGSTLQGYFLKDTQEQGFFEGLTVD